MKRSFLLIILVSACFSFQQIIRFYEEKPIRIPASQQRGGDSAEGYKYLTTGDYVKGGIPYDLFVLGAGKSKNYLNRQGLNANLSHEYTVVTVNNGEKVVAPNCMQCHAQVFDSSLYLGLGNTFIDFTGGEKRFDPKTFEFLEKMLKSSPRKYEAAKPFLQAVETIGPYIKTEVRGINAADRLTAVLAAHRDPVTFKWVEKPNFELSNEVVPTDVPAWWLLKKKHAMFHNGFGRGDFGRFLMASNLLTVNDTAESREVDNHISDVLAFINKLQPPKYPRTINQETAKEGEAIFVKNCSKCHGKYGEQQEYPNLMIPESIVQTDSLLLKSNYQNPQLINWFNNSWFARGDHPAKLEPFNGYIAPPLDGVWITSPYFHNGSVPTLEGVLNSKARPQYWSRDFNHPKYDYENIGWVFEKREKPGDNTTYNTNFPGYGNYGHNFGDKLSDKERSEVIEYLKTL